MVRHKTDVLDAERAIGVRVGENGEPRSSDRDSKSFSWGEIKAGDGTMDAGATLTLFSDGHASWAAVVSSTDTNDEWEISFVMFAENNQVLFTMPYFDYPNNAYFYKKMENANQKYAWNYDNWRFDITKYAYVHRVSIRYDC